ncbi:MAG: DUF2183 domain-containing protein [Deltaproteobacteria bacterium]|nr:DUF2183 domain-containing protein [Deltaproteobacteria bacterium]
MSCHKLFCFIVFFWSVCVGCSSPGVSDLASDEEVILFPASLTYNSSSKKWELPVHAWVYERETGSVLRHAFVNQLFESIKIAGKDLDSSLFKKRVWWFVVDNERNKHLVIEFNKKTFALGEKTGANGHVRDKILFDDMPAEIAAQPLPINIVLGDDRRHFGGEAQYIPSAGASVISDIDDTIKVSHVTDKRELIQNTFFREFKPAPGMALLYQKLKAKGYYFHYVSASPWQLFEPLYKFFKREGFPPALYYLKDVRLKDTSVLNLFSQTLSWKIDIIEGILKQFPGHHFILVGDSGEQDPEAYGEISRRYKNQIQAVWIRNVTQETRDNARFKKAFDTVPDAEWNLFTEASEINIDQSIVR